MEQEPPRQQDPLALAFFGAAIALLTGLLLYVLVFKAPEPATPARTLDLAGEVRRQVEGIVDKLRDKPAAKHQPSPPVTVPGVRLEAGRIEVGRTWRYAVVVESPAWRDITLTYRTQREGRVKRYEGQVLRWEDVTVPAGTYRAASSPSWRSTASAGR